MLSLRRLRATISAVRLLSVASSSSAASDAVNPPPPEPPIASPLESSVEDADSAVTDVVGASAGRGSRKGWENLETQLLRLTYAKRSAAAVIRKWIEDGHRVHKYKIVNVVRRLRGQKRFKHALEICEWMAQQKDFQLLPGDYAIHLDLVDKVRGLASAEKFFEDLPEPMKKSSTLSSLLHVYVQNNAVSKAEALMEDMSSRGFLKCCVPYNHMMKLYIINGQRDKIPVVVEDLKKNTLPDVVTYNLWLTACVDNNDVKGAEKAFLDMQRRNISADWMTYSIITKVYINEGMLHKARKALIEMEKVVSKEDRKAYCSLITLQASVNDKNGVIRIWKELKSMFRKMSDEEYSCVLASLVRLGDIEEAESIFHEWESVSGTRNTKVSNILLSAYTKNGMTEKAQSFHEGTEQRGTKPNYVTWELLAWGYLEKNDMAEVFNCLKKAFAALKKWKPNEKIVRAVFDNLEISGDIENAEKFLVMLRDAAYVNTEIYNSLLRTYAKAGKMPLIVAERMAKDKVQPNEETKQLILSTSRLCISDGSHFL